jgi:hypothetical protein
MKKIYTTLAIMVAVVSANAQTPFHVTFEDQGLIADTAFNDAGAIGGYNNFNSGSVVFPNHYTPGAFAYWNGFSMSSMLDDTTQSSTNDLSSITASGHNSQSYGVFYPAYDSTFRMTFAGNASTLDSMFITNTTYAYLEMLNGGYGKVFGSVNGADGNPDGTNGNDFFILTIYGHDQNNVKTDSMDVDLADFRFASNTQDYILNTWKKVTFTGFDNIAYLTFGFESSDNHPVYGINTPTYFALDDIYGKTGNANLANYTKSEFSVYPNPVSGLLNIKQGMGVVYVYNSNGVLVETATHNLNSTLDFSSYTSGMYFVELVDSNGSTSRTKVTKQ